MQDYKKFTDDQLVNAFANGDNQAFDVLLSRHQQRVYNYILYLVKDESLADDAFQETFVKAITTIKHGRYSADGRFASWISRIAHNIVIDHFRQSHNETSLNVQGSDTDLLNQRIYAEDNIEDLLINTAIRNDLRHLIKALPAEQRQVLVMRYYNDMPFKDIAEKTGVSINTALGRMRYAILNMRRLIKENNIELAQ
ncbi:MAG: sigma-70 family RNA polymerase sigma factor [Muribaculaceae bacterium]|nr:sigma-70 family RNA polymerase sigma factor [Muribaculaceae bacterium]